LQEIVEREQSFLIDNPRIAFVSVSSVALKLGKEIISPVRINYPKISQLLLATHTRDYLESIGMHPSIEVIDMKAMDPERFTKLGTVRYGKYKLTKYRVGADFKSLTDRLKELDFVCITSNFTQEAGVVTDFLDYVRKVNPRAITAVGGTDATSKERAAYHYADHCDVVFVGEGQKNLPRLVEMTCRDNDFYEIVKKGIKNVVFNFRPSYFPDSVDSEELKRKRIQNRTFKKGRVEILEGDEAASGKIEIKGPYEAACSTLTDKLDFSLVDLATFTESGGGDIPDYASRPVMYLETSKGCINRCEFCTTPWMKGKYRFMSVDEVKAMLDHYQEAGTKTLLLSEDNILARIKFGRRDELLEMFRYMREQEFAWEFSVGFEVGQLVKKGEADKELVEALFYNNRDYDTFVGCYRALVPLESLRTKDEKGRYRKLAPLNNELRVIDAIAAQECPKLNIDIMIGELDETEESLRTTTENALMIKERYKDAKTKIHFSIFCITPLPGTMLMDQGRLAYRVEEHPELYSLATSVVKGDHLPPERIFEARREMNKILNGEEMTGYWAQTGKINF
jgi:hypothetical protein